MDKSKSPGIYLDHIDLLECHISDLNLEKPKLSYSLKLVDKIRKESPDKKMLFLFFSFDLMHGIEKPPFKFVCTFAARYSRNEKSPNMKWEEFQDVAALAHIIPYLREFISNMTDRLPVPALIIPPINAYKLLADYIAARKEPEEIPKTKK